MKKYVEPSIMLVSILNSESVLNTLSGGDEEGYGEPMANINGYNDEEDDRDGGRRGHRLRRIIDKLCLFDGTTLTRRKTINLFLTESSRKGGSSCAGAAAVY